MKCNDLITILEKIAPPFLAESWDNTGLIIGEEKAEIKKVLVALDVTDEVIDEAISLNADIIVTHHPLIFGSIKQINDKTPLGKKLLKLIKNGIGHYAMHTNLDVSFGGTNDILADYLCLSGVEVLSPTESFDGITYGLGRIGNLLEEKSLKSIAEDLKHKLGLSNIRIVGAPDKKIKKIGLCTGSGFEFMEVAVNKGADLYITADLRYHESQKALDLGIALIDATHYASENIVVTELGKYIKNAATDLEVIESCVDGQVFKDI